MRWLVTGARGQLGTALVGWLRDRDEPVAGHDARLDVTDAAAVEAALDGAPGGPPDWVVNAAAFTHVDRCESEPERADAVNARAPAHLAQACRQRGAGLVHVSTDYVFAGDADRPYTEDDPTGPRSVYGRTKLAGERAVLAADPGFLVVRTSWVFGRGRNFVASVLAQARERAGRPGAALRVVDDQHGRPTRAADLARGLVGLVEAGGRGLYHLANQGEATWWDVARAALDHAGLEGVPVERIRTGDLDLPAPRPRYSVLDCGKAAALGVRLPHWREALAAHLDSDDAPPGARAPAGGGPATPARRTADA